MATKRSPTQDLLDKVLEGHRPGEAEVELIKDYMEDQFFDVKSGRMKDPAAVVREYVTGFANALGGVLVLCRGGGPSRRSGLRLPASASEAR